MFPMESAINRIDNDKLLFSIICELETKEQNLRVGIAFMQVTPKGSGGRLRFGFVVQETWAIILWLIVLDKPISYLEAFNCSCRCKSSGCHS